MKQASIFLITILCLSQVFAVNTDFQAVSSIEKARKSLEKTEWGQLGLAMLEVQLATNGPLDELQNSFMALSMDLQFKIDMENRLYQEKLGDHNAIEGPILERIRQAEADIAGFTQRLDEQLYPQKDQLETQIANDHTLIDETTTQKDAETRERELVVATFNEVHETTLDQKYAVDDAIQFLESLKNVPSAFLQVTNVQNLKDKLMNIRQVLKKTDANNPMIKIILTFTTTQNFTDQTSLARVLKLMEDINTEITNALILMEQDNEDLQAAYQTMQDQYQNTLDLANTRNLENGELLSVTNDEIASVESQRDARQEDLDVANAELDAETARWAGETATHDQLVGSIQDELDAVMSCVQIFSNAELSGELVERLDQK